MPADVLEAALASLDAARVALAKAIEIQVEDEVPHAPKPAMLLTIPEAGGELGASRTWIFGAVRDGVIPAVTIEGLGRRIRRQDLEAFVASLRAVR